MPTKPLTPLEVSALRRQVLNSVTITSAANITGTKAQFNAALTDGDFLFVGDVISGGGSGTFIVDDGDASGGGSEFSMDDGGA